MSMPRLVEAARSAGVWPPTLALDPGSQSTGVCLRVGVEAVEAVTVEAPAVADHAAACVYASHVVADAISLLDRHAEALAAAAEERGEEPAQVRVAVETLVAPTAQRVKGRRVAVGPRVLASLPGAATVLGAVTGTWPDAILVPPRGGGEGGWEALPGNPYPSNLRGRTPKGWARDGADRSHQRSAWAIAGAAHALDTTHPATPEPPTRALARRVVETAAAQGPDLGDPAAVAAALDAALSAENAGSIAHRLPDLAAALLRREVGDEEMADAMRSAVATLEDG